MDHDANMLRQHLLERFALAPADLDRYRLVRQSPKRLACCPADHEIPLGLTPLSLGLQLSKCNTRRPKISTGAARVLGRYARQNRIELDRERFQVYVHRQDLPLAEADLKDVTGEGYVLVFYAGAAVGLAFLTKDTTSYRLHSLFPKDWAPATEREDGVGNIDSADS